jgi:hypothetical protein
MTDAKGGFDRAPALEAEMTDCGPDAVDDGFAGVMGIERRGAGRRPLIRGKKVGKDPAFLAPDLGIAAIGAFIEDRLGERAPADIADQSRLRLGRRRPALLR